MSNALSNPRRSVLYVPAGNAKALAKVASLSCDSVVIDLEDAVTPEAKDAAREAMRTFLARSRPQGKEIVVRINALDTPWGTEDLLAARAAGADAVLVPKVDDAAALRAVAGALAETDAPDTLRIWAMIETAAGIANARSIAEECAGSGRLECLVVGTNDIALETGVGTGEERAFLVPWLMQIVLAARLAGIAALDGVYNDFRDGEGLARECAQGRAMGFDGKTLIHPSQIEAANARFGVDPAALEEARRIVERFESTENAGIGVIQIDGRMVERLHLEQARRLISRAEAIALRQGDPA